MRACASVCVCVYMYICARERTHVSMNLIRGCQMKKKNDFKNGNILSLAPHIFKAAFIFYGLI